MYAYCRNNDILIKAKSVKEAKKYALHRLSPAYGHKPGRANNLALRRISAKDADALEDGAIYWNIVA